MSNYITAITPNDGGRSNRPQLKPGIYSETTTKDGKTNNELVIQDVVSMNVDDDAQKNKLTLRGKLIDGKRIFMQIPSGQYQSMTIYGASFLPRTEIQKILPNSTYDGYDLTHSRYEDDESNYFSVSLSNSSGINRVSINGSSQKDSISVHSMPKNSLLHVEGSHHNIGAIPADIIHLDPEFSGKLKVTSGCTDKDPKQGSTRGDFQENANIHAKPIVLQGSINGYNQINYAQVSKKPIIDGSSFLLEFENDGSHKSKQLK